VTEGSEGEHGRPREGRTAADGPVRKERVTEGSEGEHGRPREGRTAADGPVRKERVAVRSVARHRRLPALARFFAVAPWRSPVAPTVTSLPPLGERRFPPASPARQCQFIASGLAAAAPANPAALLSSLCSCG
jgi:hypothetical protein